MPLNSAQLAELVERAKRKAPPVVSPPPPLTPATLPQRSVRSRQATSSHSETLPSAATAAPSPAPPATAPQLEHAITAMPDDFPIGWCLEQNSWRFHRRFYAVLRRPMHRGEYSYLLHQVRFGRAEHIGENCWRVTLPDRRTTLPIRASKWTLLTILPKGWQPPEPPSTTAKGG